LVEHESVGKQTDIDQALEYLNGVIKKKAIVFLLSDFLAEDYERSLKVTARKHDLTGIRVFDAMDEALPNVGVIPAIDPETGETGWLNTASRKVRQKYWETNHRKVDFYRNNFNRSGAGVVEIGVEQSYVKQLMGYFKKREARR
jgi:hypothetical protein